MQERNSWGPAAPGRVQDEKFKGAGVYRAYESSLRLALAHVRAGDICTTGKDFPSHTHEFS